MLLALLWLWLPLYVNVDAFPSCPMHFLGRFSWGEGKGHWECENLPGKTPSLIEPNDLASVSLQLSHWMAVKKVMTTNASGAHDCVSEQSSAVLLNS